MQHAWLPQSPCHSTALVLTAGLETASVNKEICCWTPQICLRMIPRLPNPKWLKTNSKLNGVFVCFIGTSCHYLCMLFWVMVPWPHGGAIEQPCAASMSSHSVAAWTLRSSGASPNIISSSSRMSSFAIAPSSLRRGLFLWPLRGAIKSIAAMQQSLESKIN